MRLKDADELLKKTLPKNPNAKFRCVPVEDIESAPTIEERKKGRWINHRNDRGHNIADCDQCGETMQWYDPDPKPNYCPICGSDMREVENEQTN